MTRLLNAESGVERVQIPARRSGIRAGEANGHTRVVLSGQTTLIQIPQNGLEHKRFGAVVHHLRGCYSSKLRSIEFVASTTNNMVVCSDPISAHDALTRCSAQR
jgi:hypothetical protein